MSLILRQSTAKAVSFGPALDKTDGVTLEVGLVSAIDHATTGILLSKNGGALTIRSQAVTASTYDAYGNYIVTLSTTDTNTVGTLRMQFSEAATCLPIWQDFVIVEEAVYDALFAASATGVPALGALEATLTTMKGATFAEATDSLEAIRDRGDAAWDTATGFATTAEIADVPTVAEFNARTIPSADYTIVSDLGTVQTADHTAAIAAVKVDTAAILIDTAEIGAAGAGLTAIPQDTRIAI